MKHLAPACFRAFACAAGSCPDSCCRAGWEIVVHPDTCELYRTLPGPAAERVRKGVLPGVETILRQNENRVCVLLDPDGLCHVQRNFGHEALCRVCREYPRFHREFGNLTEHGLSLSCPTAYALATSAPPVWEEWEDEAPVVPNELDPEAYLRLRRGRTLALEILTREELSLERRLTLVWKLAAAMQSAPERRIRHDYALRLKRWESLPSHRRDKHCLSGLRSKQSHGGRSRDPAARGLINQRTCSAVRVCLAANAFVPNAGQAMLVPTRSTNAAALARRFLSLEILSPAWKDALERFAALADGERAIHDRPSRAEGRTTERPPCGELLSPPDPEPYARWLWYALYKYWLDALDDGNLLGRVARALDMLLLGLAMDRAFPAEGPFLRRISREIEHCEENLAALLQ